MILMQSFVLFPKPHSTSLFYPCPLWALLVPMWEPLHADTILKPAFLTITWSLSHSHLWNPPQGTIGLWDLVYSLEHIIMRIKQLLGGILRLKEMDHEQGLRCLPKTPFLISLKIPITSTFDGPPLSLTVSCISLANSWYTAFSLLLSITAHWYLIKCELHGSRACCLPALSTIRTGTNT